MYGQYQVTHTSQEVFPLYLKRTFNIAHGREVRPLVQYCYTAWPDHGVPQTTDELLQFRTTVRKAHNDDQSMVVHCSAGVGRTGTFIGMDRYLDSCSNLDAKQDNDVHKIVRDLRSSRNFMVQAQAQYVYLYEACRDGLTRLHQKAAREAAMAAKDEQAREEQIVSELEADVARGEAAIRETHRQWQVKLHSDGAKIIDPDVSQAYVAATPYTADIVSLRCWHGHAGGRRMRPSCAGAAFVHGRAPAFLLVRDCVDVMPAASPPCSTRRAGFCRTRGGRAWQRARRSGSNARTCHCRRRITGTRTRPRRRLRRV